MFNIAYKVSIFVIKESLISVLECFDLYIVTIPAFCFSKLFVGCFKLSTFKIVGCVLILYIPDAEEGDAHKTKRPLLSGKY